MMYSTVMAPMVAGKMVVQGAVQAGTMATHAAVDAGTMASNAVVGAGNAVVEAGTKASTVVVRAGTVVGQSVVGGSKAILEGTTHAMEMGGKTMAKSSRALVEGTSSAVGMGGKTFGKSARDMMKSFKWASLRGFNTSIKSKKSKWEEGMDVIDQILDPDSEAYQALTPDQRQKLVGVKKLLIKGTNFGGLNNKNQHTPQDLEQSMAGLHPEGDLRGSVRDRNADASMQSFDMMQILEEGRDARRRASMRMSSVYILQEYAGVKEDATLFGEVSVSTQTDVQSRRGTNNTDHHHGIDSPTDSTTDCSEAYLFDDSEKTCSRVQRNVLSIERYFVPPEFSYLSRNEQLSVYELLKWESIGKWDFNVFDLDKATKGKALLFVGWAVMGAPYSQHAMAKELGFDSELEKLPGYSFMGELQIPQEKLYNFVRVIE